MFKRFDASKSGLFKTPDGLREIPGFEMTGPGAAVLRVLHDPETGIAYVITNAPVVCVEQWTARVPTWLAVLWLGIKMSWTRRFRRKTWGFAIAG